MVNKIDTLKGILSGFFKFSLFILAPAEILRAFGIPIVPRLLYPFIALVFIFLEVLRINVKGTVGQPILSAAEYVTVMFVIISKGKNIHTTIELMNNKFYVEIGIVPIVFVLVAFVIIPAIMSAFLDWLLSEEI